MTPTPRGRKASKTILSNEQISHLNNQFASVRRLLVCQSCNKTGSINRNGSTTADPPQPCFLCKSCGKVHNAPTMAELVEQASKTLQNPPPVMDDMEISREPASNSDINVNASSTQINIETLLATIQQLTAELQQAKAEIKELRNQITQQPNQQRVTDIDTQFPSLGTASQVSTPWRDVDRLNKIKQSMKSQNQKRRIQRQEAAARFLQPPSNNQGFQYIYLPTKARVPFGQLRSRLRRLEINNSRILDINYPARNVVALLVHNDYAPELKEHLKKFRIQVKEDFDPCDGSILKDPKYENSSNEERDNMAYMHHCNRMERALTYIRPPVKFAVARYFYEQGWIGKSLFDEIVTSHRPQFTEPLCIEDDDEMAIENPLDRLSEL
ncbi:hypothetical protein G6F55_011139 [Rhizopus delemar]|uniref:Uncharacterized protein n=3 Tax=Rhizopus TaxID=4842 RepID=I1C0N1_RHIO9|nr:hypothetical protein RO3G_06716 [Rhizopus delemar RA 99-880]KAG1447355.1 hypothetical protein G6F55_011139 [Rhizopus delemar]KAG1536438.1 hypothetical protein G6F51_010971 [Rhizopus arrhizus]KAG1489770.1 hypothetical protein G6F54_011200 [Rhizopus delemar]KAG1503035.1 hypothetical protein G6F53_010723 [Rhizopus delemar]|eukprot:EIE82011.1 hypothetical protein RO3G_06716 [Rhizopus delemar RA 99-880]